MSFNQTKARVSNRGEPPDSFLSTIIDWAKYADADIFSPNSNSGDIYTSIEPVLGPWESLLHRRAAMLEVMRVHAGFESSWNWNEGVDITNQSSMKHLEGQETGIFQVSFDSTYIANGAMKAFALENGIGTAATFIPAMKVNHGLALNYYARLIRINIRWAGPLVRHEIDPWLRRGAVEEFQTLLQS
jgi:hypothetical protein